MTMLEKVERILRHARSDVRSLDTEGADLMDLVMIELAIVNLDGSLAAIRAAVSPESADIEAPEVTHKSH